MESEASNFGTMTILSLPMESEVLNLDTIAIFLTL